MTTPEKNIDQDALDILSDDHMRAALMRKRDNLTTVLADAMTDKMMPDYDEYPENIRANIDERIAVVTNGIKAIDARLNKATEALRTLKLVEKEPAE